MGRIVHIETIEEYEARVGSQATLDIPLPTKICIGAAILIILAILISDKLSNKNEKKIETTSQQKREVYFS